MKYLQKTFTLPSGGNRLSQRKWDHSLLTREEFIAKYGEAEWSKLSTASTSAEIPTTSV
jgi:hypothetical protein